MTFYDREPPIGLLAIGRNLRRIDNIKHTFIGLWQPKGGLNQQHIHTIESSFWRYTI